MATSEISVTVNARPKLTKEQALVLGIQTSRARGKAHFSNASAKLAELKALAGPGNTVTMPDGRRFAVVDLYAGNALLKKMVYFDQFELQEIK